MIRKMSVQFALLVLVAHAVTLGSSSAHAQDSMDEPLFTMASTGQFLVGDILIPDGSEVVALVSKDNAYEIVYTKIEIDTVPNGSMGDMEDVRLASGQSSGMILYREEGLQDVFAAGPVQMTDADSGFLYPGRQLRVNMAKEPNGNDWWCLVALGSVTDSTLETDSGTKHQLAFQNYQLKLHDHSDLRYGCTAGGQTILDLAWTSYQEEASLIRWIGDLDRDNKPDLLLQLGKYNSGQPTLFLSSFADDGQFVKRVACFLATGC